MVSAANLLLVAVVAGERLVELSVARRHAGWALAAGGVEHGRGHYPFMVGLHVLLLAGAAIEPILFDRPFAAARFAAGCAALVAAAALRLWTIATLGRRWTTRVIVLPGWPLLTGGPFRFMRHPNYVAVVLEVAALPIAVGAWFTAAAAGLMNLLLLAVRIRCEEEALGIRGGAR
jgi:methyltransferase